MEFDLHPVKNTKCQTLAHQVSDISLRTSLFTQSRGSSAVDVNSVHTTNSNVGTSDYVLPSASPCQDAVIPGATIPKRNTFSMCICIISI